jgi:cell division GTPase FtsZ
MSDNPISGPDQEVCKLCQADLGEADVVDHLRDQHRYEKNQIDDKYGSQMVQQVVEDRGPNQRDPASDLREVGTCELCFNEWQDLAEHLRSDHTKEDVREEYGSDVATTLFDGSGRTVDTPSRDDTVAKNEVGDARPDEENKTLGANEERGDSESNEGVTTSSATPSTDRDAKNIENEIETVDEPTGGWEADPTANKRSSTSTGMIGSAGSREDKDRAEDEERTNDPDGIVDRNPTGDSKTRAGETESYKGKWAMIGVGGAGNRILDSVLMRTANLRDKDDNENIWEGALQSYMMLNTNTNEVAGTWYVDKMGWARTDVETRMLIGYTSGGGSGAGRNPGRGKKWMRDDLYGDDSPDAFRRWPISLDGVRGAQSVMFLHSVVKGTGTGATPVLAKHIDQEVLSKRERSATPILSTTIIPREGSLKYNKEVGANAVLGLGRMASATDLVIAFDNARLGEMKEQEEMLPPVYTEARRRESDHIPPTQAVQNRALTLFLEAFSLSSNQEYRESKQTRSLSGSLTPESVDDGFDVPDSYWPIRMRYPKIEDKEMDEHPAVIGAPVLNRADITVDDPDTFRMFVDSTLRKRRLVAFDPGTAWGGVFICFGPHEQMEYVSEYLSQYMLHEVLEDEFDLDLDSAEVYAHQVVVPSVDNLYMWGVMWNPRLESLQRMKEHAENQVKPRGDYQGALLQDHWHEIEDAFQFLGRDNMPS